MCSGVWSSSLVVCRQVPQNNLKMRLKMLLFAPHWLAPHPFPFLSPADLLASCCSPTYNTHNIQRGPCRLCSSPSSSSSLLEAPHQWDDCLMLLRCAAHRHHCAACCPSAPCRCRATHLRAAPCHCCMIAPLNLAGEILVVFIQVTNLLACRQYFEQHRHSEMHWVDRSTCHVTR